MLTSPRRKIALASLVALVALGVGLALGPMSGASSGRHAAAPTTTVAPTTTTTAPTTTTTAAPTTTTTVAPATTTTAAAPTPPADGTAPPAAGDTLRSGSSGPAVQALQERLTALGFWLGTPDGTYGRTTQQAVMAFQKANGLHRDGSAGPATQAALATAARPTPRSAADGIEIDLGRQLLMIVEGGQVTWTINTSTGKASTPTPPGDFTVRRQIDGIRHAELGDLYRPKYFNGGVAVHGSPSIPGYAASHGCARVSNAAMDFLWASGKLEVGTPVRVH